VSGVRAESIWLDTAPERPAFPRLEGKVEADVAVLGGGIVGVTTALMLREQGLDVVLIEADRLGRGVTGHTTAKVSSQHGLIYSRIRSRYGAEGARTYGLANEGALAWMSGRVENDGIECDFRRRPSYAYMSLGSGRSKLEDEVEAALEAGLPASLVDETPLPYAVEGAVRFDDQAEFHVGRYLSALVDQLDAAGCRIYEGSRAVEVDEDELVTVKTPGGTASAGRVVVATHFPFLDRSLAFARVHPQRSYALVCRIAGEPPAGMFISGDSPTRSVRAVPVAGEELLLVGGEGHRPGTGGDTRERYAALETFAREHWDVVAVEYRWSSQDNTTIDLVPYVGPLTPFTDRVLMATGFAKWGMTGGTAAGMILCELAQGRDHEWAGLFSPNRFKPLSSGAKFVEENAEAGFRMVYDRLANRPSRALGDLAAGEGDIVSHEGEKVAGYRDDDGQLHAVSTRCTHLGCQVNWNAAERSWDCACHGSRFAPDGTVLHGPAVHRLERKPVREPG
jgi:glycine/D-amino acid oxidase-like deaminating enzyme/nitrite reductase/ring-hydroxylating ferredoxin subunit